MPLRIKPNSRLAHSQPLCALVIVKAMAQDGGIFYMTVATTDLHAVECLGMVEFAAARIRSTL
jgi:hypothetical protein